MKKIVVLTGAGISAESGLKTFRDSDGLWEGYNIEDVATPDACATPLWYRLFITNGEKMYWKQNQTLLIMLWQNWKKNMM